MERLPIEAQADDENAIAEEADPVCGVRGGLMETMVVKAGVGHAHLAGYTGRHRTMNHYLLGMMRLCPCARHQGTGHAKLSQPSPLNTTAPASE